MYSSQPETDIPITDTIECVEWLVAVLRMPRFEACQHTFCVNVNLGLRVTER